MKAWIDIDNPPQVQYLCPFATHIARSGRATPLVTARDYGSTINLVRRRGLDFVPVGHAAGAGKLDKIAATLGRALALVRLVRGSAERPRYVISSSRSSMVAARLLGIPAFIFCDYEFAELGIYRRLGGHILHPQVIPASHFQGLGFAAERLMPFPGLKEDISFTHVDFAAVKPLDLGAEPSAVKVLLRPPATRSHYYRGSSGSLYHEILVDLSRREGLQLVFSPRYPEQVEEVKACHWSLPPIVLDNTADFVALLQAVDAVVSSGGTMLREAAYLGVHAYSIFLGPRGAVDRHLADRGLLTFAHDIDTFRACRFVPRQEGKFGLVPQKDILGKIIDDIEAYVRA